MKIIVVDDNKTFREGIKFYLKNMLLHNVIATAADGLEFLQLKNLNEADIILMDIEMPNMNGVETVKKALWRNSNLKFIAVTDYTDKAYLLELIGAGFKSCVFKSNIYEGLKEAITSVMNNELFFPEDMNLKHDKI
ncbi:MAG: response regulator [Bacteroidales bacterium]|nr:response regulator [Bacteroidales bacterium]